jgi:hypothetical protein
VSTDNVNDDLMHRQSTVPGALSAIGADMKELPRTQLGAGNDTLY